MTRTYILLSALIGFSFLTPFAAHAEDKAPPAKAEKSEVKKPLKKIDLKNPEKVEAQSAQQGPTGKTKEWIDAENKLIDTLGDKDKESFLILRNKHSYIQATRVVERDVGAGIKSCGDKNPSMKEKMDARYKQWKSAVDPIIDTAKKQLDKDIDNQKMVDSDKFHDVLDLHDEAYEAAEKQVTKTPVTTAEACQGLLDSMDRTEDNMISILRETLLPESVIRKRAADQEKAQKKASAEKQAKTPDSEPAKTE